MPRRHTDSVVITTVRWIAGRLFLGHWGQGLRYLLPVGLGTVSASGC